MFNPTFYWTGDFKEDAERINRPHINAEGAQENRILETIELLELHKDYEEFTFNDCVNVQNYLLKKNNWKGIKPGFRTHNVTFEEAADWWVLPQLTQNLFPVTVRKKEDLLEWYKLIQTIHPLSDLNGRTFGIVVSVLYHNHLKLRPL